MRLLFQLVILLSLAGAATAQTSPYPSPETPRIQTAYYEPNEATLLTMLPSTLVTVMFQPGETISGVSPDDNEDFRVRVASDRNSLVILPSKGATTGNLQVTTPGRSYNFVLRVEESRAAALLVRVVDAVGETPGSMSPSFDFTTTEVWDYTLRGDREVRPERLSDDGSKTRIRYYPGQALPAVFAIGPTGEEEVVNGYMRNGEFVIDRVYDVLVFRIDRNKAKATRNKLPRDLD